MVVMFVVCLGCVFSFSLVVCKKVQNITIRCTYFLTIWLKALLFGPPTCAPYRELSELEENMINLEDTIATKEIKLELTKNRLKLHLTKKASEVGIKNANVGYHTRKITLPVIPLMVSVTLPIPVM
jgi:hypothetical protein